MSRKQSISKRKSTKAVYFTHKYSVKESISTVIWGSVGPCHLIYIKSLAAVAIDTCYSVGYIWVRHWYDPMPDL